MPWTAAEAGEAAAAAERRTVGALGPEVTAAEGRAACALGSAMKTAPGVEVSAG